MAMDAASKQTFGALSAYLSQLGLGSLFALDANGQPSGWLWEQIKTGVDTADQLTLAIEATPEFQTRYGIITEMRRRAAAGEPVRVPTIGQVREYEDTVSRVMRQAGMPTWFYDSYTDAQDLMLKGMSPAEVEERIGKGWSMVRDVDPAVRQAFSNFYGVEGDAALAAFVLDPTRTVAKVEQSARAAYTAGYGRTIGLDVDKVYAERIAQLPKTEAGIQQDLGEVSKMSGLYTETITETDDLTANTGLEAVALGDGTAMNALQRRSIQRSVTDRSSSGGAAATQAGVTGLRSV